MLRVFADCIENDIVLVSTVWPAIAVLWEGTGEFVLSLNIDKLKMVVYGYVAMYMLHTIMKEVVETFLELNKCGDDERPCNPLIRILAEDIYVFMACTTAITIWQGQPVSVYYTYTL